MCEYMCTRAYTQHMCECVCVHAYTQQGQICGGKAVHTYYGMHVEVRGQSWVSVLPILLFETRSLGCLLMNMTSQLAQRPQGVLLSLLLSPHRTVIDRHRTGLYHGLQGTELPKSSPLYDKCFAT